MMACSYYDKKTFEVITTLAFLVCIFTGAFWILQITFYGFLVTLAVTLSIIYFAAPLIFRCNAKVQRHFVYQSSAKLPPKMKDLSNPKAFGMYGTRNLCLELGNGHHIALWHVVPHNQVIHSHGKAHNDEFWELSLKESMKDVVLYFHGNTGTRAFDHRKELYTILQLHGHHVIAFDYRGFADSSHVELSEVTTVEDGILVYNWLSTILQGSKHGAGIILWGHSLGTAIASSTVRHLPSSPKGLILEAPFTSIGDAMRLHRKAKFYSFIDTSFFHWIFVNPLHKNNITYETHLHVASNIHIPILILHAEDDQTVPIKLGRQLFQLGFHARFAEGAKPIYLRELGVGHGHKYICRSPEFMQLVQNFIQSI